MSENSVPAAERNEQDNREDVAQQLRENTLAIRFSETRLGTTKTMTAAQKERVANLFGADSKYVSGGRKIVNTDHPAYKKVTSLLSQAAGVWQRATYPYPEHTLGPLENMKTKGVRLVSRDQYRELEDALSGLKAELDTAVSELQEAWASELLPEVREKLNELGFDIDFVADVRGHFDFRHDVVNVEPPEYLQRMHPEIYAREQARVRQQFENAVRMQEDELASQLENLVADMVERLLSKNEDGSDKKFSARSTNGLRKFFDEFQDMNLGTSGRLDRAVAEAKRALEGVTPDQMNGEGNNRQALAESMQKIHESMDGMLVTRARRQIKIDLGPEPQGEEGAGEEAGEETTAEPVGA
jgi:hypothetical protein